MTTGEHYEDGEIREAGQVWSEDHEEMRQTLT